MNGEWRESAIKEIRTYDLSHRPVPARAAIIVALARSHLPDRRGPGLAHHSRRVKVVVVQVIAARRLA